MKILLINLFIILNAGAAFEISSNMPLFNGSASSGVASVTSFASYLINPALSAPSEGSQAGFVYHKPYGLNELNFGGLVTHTRFGQYGAGAAINTFGNQLYRESRLSINLSRRMAEKFWMGTSIHIYSVSITNYGNSWASGVDLGVCYGITSQFYTGFALQNINRPGLYGKEDQLPMHIRWGFSYLVSDKMFINAALQKDEHF
ncbi:MAG: hypothetical protein WAN36_08530, partial [Calditrichia bacterium]